jgi:arylsulfatase A-like enzyme
MKSALRSLIKGHIGFSCLGLIFLPMNLRAENEMNKPNIIFFLIDDLGIKDLGVEGSSFYETPHIDALAKSGMRFTQAYAASSVCSPSRASILTGQYPTRHGITDWIGAEVGMDFAKKRQTKLLPPDYVRNLPARDNLASVLKEAGYTTFFAGKWHLGNETAWPEKRGFDINVGGWDAGSPIGGKGGYYAPWKNPRLPAGPDGEPLNLRLAEETASFMKQNKQSPFLVFFPFYAVHGPLQTTKSRWKKFRSKAADQEPPKARFAIDRTLPVRQVQDHPVYAGLVEEMDEAVGIVLKKLEDLGLAENTIVIFTSDNGGVVSGDSYSSSEFPFRGGKGRQWEGGTRVPLYIKVPGVTKPGSTCGTPVSGIDLLPTILKLAHTPWTSQHSIDGVSLVPLLIGQSISERPLFWHYPHYSNQGGEPSAMIRRGDWKLIHYWEDGRNELYDLANDIGEQNDLSAKKPKRTEELWVELKQWLAATGAKIPLPNPDFQAAWTENSHKAALSLKDRLEKDHAKFLDSSWQPDPTWWNSQATQD